MSWIATSLVWYLYLFIIGILFFPVALRIFRPFVDKGYPFAKTLGILLISYGIFVLGTFHILPFTKEGLLLLILIIGILIQKYFKKEINEIRKLDGKTLLLLACEELMFLLSLLALAFVRGQEPSIHGLEKFMDFGFIQSIGKSIYFPPPDMWLSADPTHPTGYPINYYYFGHLTGAMLIKLSGIAPSIGYNLILATIFAQGTTLVFSLTSSLVHIFRQTSQKLKSVRMLPALLIGLLGSFIVNLGGNLHTIYLFTKGYPNESPVPFWGIFQSREIIRQTMETTEKGFVSSMIQNANYWYPNATRFIPFTIHEFPAYSYVVADLHGHVFDIPFVLLGIGLLFILLYHWHQDGKKRTSLWDTSFIQRIPQIESLLHRFSLDLSPTELLLTIGLGGMIAINYMTNAFDGPIYLLLVIILFFLHYHLSLRFITQTVLLGISFVVFSLPFSYFFEPFATGIGINCSPAFLVNMGKFGPFLFEKDNCQTSPPWMMMVLWGFFWISFVLYGGYLYFKRRNKQPLALVERFLLLLFSYGTLLLLIPEFVYAKDIYPAHFRANTMFKLGYQAFIMMGIASGAVFYLLGQIKNRVRHLLQLIYAVCFFLIFLYPFFAFPSYYPGLFDRITYAKSPELDGAVWMEQQYPQDREIIDYINANIPGRAVILEAQGDSYTDYNRVSAYTGHPTVAGWWVHEWLWRGSADVVGKRIPDIEALYQSEDLTETRGLIQKYHVEYVVVSGIEKEKYPTLNEEKFTQIGTKVFESKDSSGALYKVY